VLATIKLVFHLLRAKLRYILFNTSSVIVLDRRLKDIEVVAHPTKGYVHITHYLYLLHNEQTEDTVYILTSNNGDQYELKKTIKNLDDQISFLDSIFFNNGSRLPKFIAAVRPVNLSYFHKCIIRVGNV
jgi:hypothetical protein